MASVSELVECVVRITGKSESNVRNVARNLLDHDVLPKSQGRRIAQVSAKDAVNLLLAVYTHETLPTAYQYAKAFYNLSLDGYYTRHVPEWVKKKQRTVPRAGDFLAAIIANEA
ncbi:MAG: hypothetical protein O7G13_03910, partial [Alphaproteobacteria bacterium]|nr:hypothetical protein [Alphaproteobacteria bacterium]